jgi:hypothetical protein
MANPNRTAYFVLNRKTICVAERVFATRESADEWLTTQEGNRKVVNSFKTGPRSRTVVMFVARVYVKKVS